MAHDRIHAREPSHHTERWTPGVIESITERDGHCVVRVAPAEGDAVELTVTVAVGELFVRRLALDAEESPVGETVWFRKRGGR